jgi:hypothetical protein
MKRKSIWILSLLLISILMINAGFISARDEVMEGIREVFSASYEIIDSVIDNLLKPLVELVLVNKGETLTDGLLFAKLLFLLIILGIVHFALKRVPFFEDQNILSGIIVFGVAFLATRWLGTQALLETIILPYSVLGIAISAGLPFIIYFLFIEFGFKGKEYVALRKFAWIFFIVIFIGLWYARSETIRNAGSYAPYIYPVTLIASILVLIFGRRIQRAWEKSDFNKSISSISSRGIRELRRELNELYEDLRTPLSFRDRNETKKRIKEIKTQIGELQKERI